MTKRNPKKTDNRNWLERLERSPLATTLIRLLMRALIDWFTSQ